VARALVGYWQDVKSEERADVLDRWRANRARLREHGCQFWVFESTDTPGRYLQFAEAPDGATLTTALERAGIVYSREPLSLTEVELN
jgi:hypothetical protein